MESATATRDAGLVERYGAEARPSFMAHVRDYIALTKPRIISLLLVTTVATMVVAMPEGLALSTVLWTMLGGYLAAGGAGAINHYLDRDRDARMARTRSRPLVSGRIEPVHGLVFGIVLGALAFIQLALTVNMLSAVLAMAGLLGYVFVYTMWLKPLTPQNIVIGGAAGAVPPLVGWAAATGSLTLDSLYPFAIVFMWTPPHFWALSLLIKDDYARTGVPMMPVVRGEESTRRQIVVYAVLLVALTLAPVATGLFGSVLSGLGPRPGRRIPRARREAHALAFAPGSASPLPLFPRLPRPALHRDGHRPGHIEFSPDGQATRRQEPQDRPLCGCDRGRRLRARVHVRDLLPRIAMADEAPQPTELVYVPEPSWDPALLAFGLAAVIAGIFVWWPYGAIGAIVAIAAVVRMFRGTEHGVARLPRRQKLTTAVLPAVQRKCSEPSS